MSLTDRREHAGGAVPTTLSTDINSSVTIITISDGTGWPTGSVGDFVVTLERGTDKEERVLCESRSGAVLTVAASGRGWDGTAARSHQSGSDIEHTWSTTEADEASAHSSGVAGHGVNVVVGTTEEQTLTDKTLTDPVINNPDISGGSIDGSVSLTGATLTGNPTLPGNPNFTGAPTIGNFTNMGHDHLDADDGGTLTIPAVTGLQTALDNKVDDTEKGAASGVATLDGSTTLTPAQIPTIPYAKLPVGTTGTTVSQGNHEHVVDAVTSVTALTARTLTDGDPGPKVMATLSLGVGTWLLFATVEGVTCNTGGNCRWRYDLTKTGGTATLTGGDTEVHQTDNAVVQGGATKVGILVVTAGPVTLDFNITKVGTGVNPTNSTTGSLVALPLHGI